MIKNVSHFMSKTLFVLQGFTFLLCAFDFAEKRLDKKAMVKFKIYDVTGQITNLYNIHITKYLKK